MSDALPPFYPGIELSVAVAPGFPSVHEAYRRLRDQKDMVCGAYALTYLLWAYGIEAHEGEPLTVDRVAALAGTGLEVHNRRRQDAVEARVERGEVPPERAETWHLQEYFTEPLATVDEGGTSPRGVVEACDVASEGLVEAIPVPAVVDGDVQLTPDAFDALLETVLSGTVTAQVITNYNLGHTLAPASLLGHKYNLVALLARWDEPESFRRMDWDVGHFTTLAGRLEREGSDRRYLLVRDSYKSFGWDGYHLQPESAVREGMVRADDERDGGLLLVVPATEREAVEGRLESLELATGLWDNGSRYAPVSDRDDEDGGGD